MNIREKFASQVKPEILAEIRSIAQSEGRQFQVIVEEAFADLIEKRKSSSPRKHVMQAYKQSNDQYGSLYERLAK